MRVELRALQQRLGITTVYVTHDQEEAMVLSDEIAVMHEGRMLQVAAPGDDLHAPGQPHGRRLLRHAQSARRPRCARCAAGPARRSPACEGEGWEGWCSAPGGAAAPARR